MPHSTIGDLRVVLINIQEQRSRNKFFAVLGEES